MQLEEFKTHFLSVTRTTETERAAAELKWQDLADIHTHHTKNTARLEDVAYLKVKTIQRMAGVHSVRWRVKSPDHLIDKIIRKLNDSTSAEKYININASNYTDVVSDLVGLRALLLFKEDCVNLHSKIGEEFAWNEDPVIYIRPGDTIPEAMLEMKIASREHKAGYRSIHYILKSARDRGEPDLVELQVRSLYEEAWSEIDHKIRYPNFSDDASVYTALMVLNRFSGSADEMASFVLGLKVINANRQNEIDAAVSELKRATSTNKALNDKVDALERATRGVSNHISHVFPNSLIDPTSRLKETLNMINERSLSNILGQTEIDTLKALHTLDSLKKLGKP